MDSVGCRGAGDAAQVVINALLEYAQANPGKTPSRKNISDLVRKTAGFKGVAASVDFDAKGDNKNATVDVYQLQNNQYPGVQVQ